MLIPRFDPPRPDPDLKCVAILFSGGPAPAANAVICGAAGCFSRNGIRVLGMLNGYSHLIQFQPGKVLRQGTAYVELDHVSLEGKRCSPGIIIGTSRANPGQYVTCEADLDDEQRCERLRNMYHALRSLGVDALISIGGDDTLSTAAKFQIFQEKHCSPEQRIRVIHLPKTIDNDYHGIDFTFGYFTAVDMMAQEIRNLRTDAQANNSYFVVQSMGRKAGWLSYGAAVAGEASLVLSLEDIPDELWTMENAIDPKTGDTILDDGKPRPRRVFDVGRIVDCVVDTMLARERQGKQYGVILVAEGLAEHLPVKELRACLSEEEFQSLKPDPYGNYPVSQVPFSRRLAKLAFDKYRELPEKKKMVRARRLIGLQFGYEVRTHPPTAFDIILGSQLGVGAYRCLAEKKLDGVMVSLHGQLTLTEQPFFNHEDLEESLVNRETLRAKVRLMEPEDDYHLLARYLERGCDP